jgi:hypothetical protein
MHLACRLLVSMIQQVHSSAATLAAVLAITITAYLLERYPGH